VSKILLAVAIIVLIGTAYSMNRDYQDTWILEGLEIPFVLFVLTFTFAFYLEKSILRRVVLAVLGRTVFTLIPAVKYAWFLGPYIDQNVQQALANHVVINGHIMIALSPSLYYSYSPLEHLSFAIFSLVLNIPIVSSMKYLPVFWSMLFPLLIYIIVKNMDFPATSTLLGYALFISAVPITMIQYVVTGTLFGSLFFLFILMTLVLINIKTNRYFWLILVFSVIALVAAHSISSIVFTALLILLLFLKRFSRLGISSFLSITKVLTIVLITCAWLMFQAGATLQTLVNIITVQVPTATTPGSEQIPVGSLKLLLISPLSTLGSIVVLYGADILFLFMTVASLLLMLRMRKKLNHISKFLAILCLVVLILMPVGVILQAGFPRLLNVAEFMLFPIFSSIFVFSILSKNTRIRKLIVGIVLFLILFLATLQFYECQPLMAPANVVHKELPPNIYSSYIGLVNSIYNRQMILFAERYVPGRIATVDPITTQIIGLTYANFSLNVVSYDPLDASLPKPQYDYFLINMPGPAGDYAGTSDLSLNDPTTMSNYILNQTIIYTNGESYVLANSP
jgi:hypothetical protein